MHEQEFYKSCLGRLLSIDPAVLGTLVAANLVHTQRHRRGATLHPDAHDWG